MTEKVGLVCFGEDTRVISRCSTNFSMLRQEISKLIEIYVIIGNNFEKWYIHDNYL